ncbi:hypothetical protein ADUPG1_013174 [Aduncisulcus paluster]|uniref:Uncharacterized protein n=1 Tax=Aduncisulcus paluster TaxID=2918883 RepID=A0ABQ5K205_9EUKA|nr:hypothetical protein ADUPG1_013174 [Aduncisulcus paluster]
MTAPPKSLALHRPRKTRTPDPMERDVTIEKSVGITYLSSSVFCAISGPMMSVKMLLEHVLGECKVAYFHMRGTKGDRIMVRCEECRYHILTLGGCSNADRGCCLPWCPNPLMVTRIGEHSQECRFQFVHEDHECECSTSIESEERK